MAANTNFAVAVHALAVLAHTKALTTSERIATSVNTNAVVVRRLLGKLAQADLVRSVPGKSGGFELMQPPKDVKLCQVLAAVEDNALFRIHENAQNPDCFISCNIKEVLADVQARVDGAVTRELGKMTLADVLHAAS